MIVTSNSLQFSVADVPPAERTGFTVNFLHPTTLQVVGALSEYVSLSFGPELSDKGAGSLAIDEAAPFWQTRLIDGRPAAGVLTDYEYVVEVVEDGSPRFWFLIDSVSQQIVGDDETQAVVMSGPGIAHVLEWAVIYRPGWPQDLPATLIHSPTNDGSLPAPDQSVSGSNDVPAHVWKFPTDWPTMRMWYTLLAAAQSRGTIPFVRPNFTGIVDSAGDAWEYVPTIPTVTGEGFQPARGIDLLTFLNTCTGQDTSEYFAMRAEWVMRPGFRLDVAKHIGTHREQQVVFYEAALLNKERMRVRDKIANYVVVEDVNGMTSLAVNTASVARWGRREVLQNRNSNVTDPARRNAIAQVYLQQSGEEKVQWTINVPYDEHGRRPFRDYDIGDWVGVSYNPWEVDAGADGQPNVIDPYRIMAITVNVDNDGIVEVELTLQDLVESRERELEIELTRIINAVNDPLFGALPTPSTPSVVTLDPNGNLGTTPIDSLIDSGGFGGTGGIQMFIQSNDPGDKARIGDLWFDTDYAPEPTSSYDYGIDPKTPTGSTTVKIGPPGPNDPKTTTNGLPPTVLLFDPLPSQRAGGV